MREFEKRQKLKSKLYSLPLLALLLIMTVATVRGAYNFMVKEGESKREAEALAIEVEDLKNREKTLIEEGERLKTEAGIEEEIKSKFNVARAGEYVALIVETDEAEASTTTEELPWWKSLFNFFGE